MTHRFDVRSKAEFQKDIKASHYKEAQIAVRLAIKKHAETGEWPEIKGIGVDYTGEFIEDDKKVTADPDFKIGENVVEITRSDVSCFKTFHQKCHKIDKMLKNGTDMVFVNGFGTKDCNYIWLNSLEWEPFVIRSKTKYGVVPMPGGGKVGWINKSAYRFDIYWFKDLFKPLPVLISSVPNTYKEILNNAR